MKVLYVLAVCGLAGIAWGAGPGVEVQTDWRLGRATLPRSYRLELKLSDADTFEGRLELDFTATRASPALVLNAKGLSFLAGGTELRDSQSSEPIAHGPLVLESATERLVLPVAGGLRPHRLYTAVFHYVGNITQDGAGLYSSSYVDSRGATQRMIVSQLRPVHARKVYPCYDDPSFRATFKLTVWHRPDQFVVSNMPALHSTLIGDRALTEFEESPPIPVFLTGLLASGLSSTEGERGFTSLAAPADLLAASYSAEIGPQLASAMESLVGITYPQVKTHQVALPRLVPVAMENWGLFNFRRENILYLEGSDPTVQKQTAARFSGHEVAHAWLGNSVTIAWWDWLWLSEMFAMYLEYFLPHIVDPSWRMDEQMAVDLHMAGLAGDSPSADPLTTRVLTPTDISNKFMGLTYTKGPGILRMVQHALGIKSFFKGIRAYLETNWGKSVTPNDLWTALEKEGTFPTNLGTIMASWTEQPGYPLISVNSKPGSAVISQSAYGEGGNGSWWVPLSWVTTAEPIYESKPKAWLPPGHSLTVPLLQDSLIILNINHAGFYRVNYDEELWSRLILQLQLDHKQVPALNRAQLVDDSIALALSGHLPIQTSLDLLSYLKGETDFIVWKAASVSLASLTDRIAHSNIYHIYKTFIGSLVEKAFRIRGFMETAGDSHTDKVMREIVAKLSCEVSSPECLKAAALLASDISKVSLTRLSPDVRGAVLCTVIQEGNEQAWKYFLAQYNANGKQKDQYLAALACSSNTQLYRELLINSASKITDDEWRAIYSVLASKRQNANSLLLILHQHINIILSRFGATGVSNLISQISGFLGTKAQLEVIQDLERLGVGGLSTIKSGIATRESWLVNNLPGIISFFKSNRFSSLVI